MGSMCFELFLLCSISVASTMASTPALILSPLIKQNRIEEAKNLSKVNPSLFLNLTSHSGFLTVDEMHNSNLFFWYFPATNKDIAKDYWIIWLQGGPGASSLVGLFDEMGPFEYDRELKLRKWSWAQEFPMLFLDNPVGAGFSFTNSPDGFVRNMTMCSEHLYSAVQQFLTLFPELRDVPLYVAGESYAGRYVPAFGIKVLKTTSNDQIKNQSINLQGLIMGNPVLDRQDIQDFMSVYFHWGLIDSQAAIALKPLQDEYKLQIKNNNSSAATQLYYDLLSKLEDIASQPQSFNLLKNTLNLHKFENFLSPEVKETLHVGDKEFIFSNTSVYKSLIPDFISNERPKMETLLEHYRILIYCGQLDLTAPCVPNALRRRRTWSWSQRKRFITAPRIPWWYNESVAGYVKSGGGLTEVLVRGAGHLVPMDKPAQAQQLISYFIRGFDFPEPTNYQLDFNNAPDLPLDYNAVFIIPEYSPSTTPKIIILANTSALTASVVINVILVLGILVAVFLFIRWKRRNEAFFYTSTADSTAEGILSLS